MQSSRGEKWIDLVGGETLLYFYLFQESTHRSRTINKLIVLTRGSLTCILAPNVGRVQIHFFRFVWNSTFNDGIPNLSNFFLIPWYRRIQACRSSQQILPAMDSCDFNMLTRDLRTRADRFQSWLVSVIPPWLESHLMKRLGKILKSRLIS